MRRRHPLADHFPNAVLEAQGCAWRALNAPEARFSKSVIARYAATATPSRFAMVKAAGDAPTEILLYDEIGFWGVTAKDFLAALTRAGDGPLTLRINSPGGDVFDGYAIYNALKARSAPVDVVIDGIAASAASFIAMAGRTVKMAEPSMMMIHNANGFCMGDRRAMADMGDILGKIDGQIAAVYAAKTKGDAANFTTAMNAETWYTASEAKDAGLCDELGAPAASDGAKNMKRSRCVGAIGAESVDANFHTLHAAMQPYDPDEDGDNDAQEAFDSITIAIGHLTNAMNALTGSDGEDGADNHLPSTTVSSTEDQAVIARKQAAEVAAAAANAAAAARRAKMSQRLALAAAEAA
jgi:ATP-dependent Clp protease protease subunit